MREGIKHLYIMSILRFLLILTAFPVLLCAQPDNVIPITNQINDDNLRSVQLSIQGAQLLLPVVDLKAANGVLSLEFDHIGDDLKDYSYTIVHCNALWQPSDLDDNQYIDGFTEDRITQIDNSLNTLTRYTHYTLPLPNRNMRWSKSGNYLLKVIDNDQDRAVVLVRRFMVVEPMLQLSGQFVKTAKVDKINTHHELDFNVLLKRNSEITNPKNDLRAIILQNGRWDNAVGPLEPFIVRGETIVFDYQDVIVFPAGKEFRFFNMSSFDYRGEFIRRIDARPTYFEVTLEPDKPRTGRTIANQNEINGQFVIQNKNINQTTLQCDYGMVLFSLLTKTPFEDKDVYVFGELSDWRLKPDCKMDYDEEAGAYYTEVFLKQGYYNYQYVVVNRVDGAIDPEGVEGNWYETGNTYTVLMYYRPFGARFDRLLSATTFDSTLRQ